MADMRYLTSVAALAALATEGSVDLSQDDIEFLQRDRLWLSADRNRARRGIEAFAYGSLDLIGLPRFPLPTEFIAAVIAKMIHPQNWQIACVVMSGTEWTEDVVLNRSEAVDPAVLFSHVLRLAAGLTDDVTSREAKVLRNVQPVSE